MTIRSALCATLLATLLWSCGGSSGDPVPTPRDRWTDADAAAWYADQPWR
ncbi:MAG: hypothetical protein WCF10_15090 [Polyangiales bacterium]